MALRFYNTLTRKKEEFYTVHPGEVRMYTCGPTVYDFAHIGNFRAYVFGDLLHRYLKYKGYKVTYVMNITDVDDKTIAGSQKERIALRDYTQRYKKAFFEDIKKSNIEPADIYPEATLHINDMVDFVKILLEKGYAYKSDGSTYFKISSFPSYGKLSHMDLKGLKVCARVSSDEYEKEQVADFALWKGWDQKDGDIFWETEVGKGRPGWHIECSVMSTKYLGKHFDIHTGGVDLIFPHHENEIAQSEAAHGEKFVNFWLHNEHLMVEGKKMAKSLGNYYTLRDLLNKGYNSIAIRYLLSATHYRQQLNFTFDGLEAAKNALQRLCDFVDNLKMVKDEKSNLKVDEIISKAKQEFEDALDDDLNVSEALGVVFGLVKDVNKLMDEKKISKSDAEKVLELTNEFDSVLGILKREEIVLDEEIKKLIERRSKAREEKNFKLADQIRKDLEAKGIILEDAPQGTKWKRRM
ncbi:MAG: cysteine--tRNA ligase [candidate division Zixibacteria bacterium]|nr:cysteine--tRNA ligase [candidate division Zixibacteria bacterium]